MTDINPISFGMGRQLNYLKTNIWIMLDMMEIEPISFGMGRDWVTEPHPVQLHQLTDNPLKGL